MLKIYGRKNSANVQKVLWACSELNVPYAHENVGGEFGRNREAWYLAMNPNAVVPTIDDDGFILWESNTIVRYLAAKHGNGTLWPSDARTRADSERWMDWQLSVLLPAIFPIFWGLIRTPPEKRDAAAIEDSRQKSIAAFSIVDARLADRTFIAGDALAVGDIPLGCFVHRWLLLPAERPVLPNLDRYYARLSQHQGFKTHVMHPLT